MKLLTKVATGFDRFLDLLAVLVAVLLVFIMLSVCAEITVRSFMNQTLRWVLEASEAGLLAITFLVAAWLLRRERHVSLDLIVTKLRPQAQTMVNVSTSIIGAIICLVIAWYGAKLTWGDFQAGIRFGGEMMFPRWPIEVVMPIGSFLFFIQFLRRAVGFLKRESISITSKKAIE